MNRVLDEDSGSHFGLRARSWATASGGEVAADSDPKIHLSGAMPPNSRTFRVRASHAAEHGRVQVDGSTSWDLEVDVKYPPPAAGGETESPIEAVVPGNESVAVTWSCRIMGSSGSTFSNYAESGSLSLQVQ